MRQSDGEKPTYIAILIEDNPARNLALQFLRDSCDR